MFDSDCATDDLRQSHAYKDLTPLGVDTSRTRFVNQSFNISEQTIVLLNSYAFKNELESTDRLQFQNPVRESVATVAGVNQVHSVVNNPQIKISMASDDNSHESVFDNTYSAHLQPNVNQ